MRINYKNIMLFLVMLACGVLFARDWFIVIFKGASFTWYGLITNIMFLGVVSLIYEYLEYYTKEKEERRQEKQKREFLERVKSL